MGEKGRERKGRKIKGKVEGRGKEAIPSLPLIHITGYATGSLLVIIIIAAVCGVGYCCVVEYAIRRSTLLMIAPLYPMLIR